MGLSAAIALLMIAATLTASFGFMLLTGTPPNAIVYSSGYITTPQMVRAGLAVDLFGTLLVATYCYLLVPSILGIGRCSEALESTQVFEWTQPGLPSATRL